MPETPELDRIKELQPQIQAIQAFLCWLESHEFWLYSSNPLRGSMASPELLIEYFGIDVARAAEERRALLASPGEQARSEGRCV